MRFSSRRIQFAVWHHPGKTFEMRRGSMYRIAVFPYCTHIYTRETFLPKKRSPLFRQKITTDARPGSDSRGSTYTGDRIDGKASLSGAQARLRGIIVIYRYVRKKREVDSRQPLRARCVSARVTLVMGLLINAIPSRRRLPLIRARLFSDLNRDTGNSGYRLLSNKGIKQYNHWPSDSDWPILNYRKSIIENATRDVFCENIFNLRKIFPSYIYVNYIFAYCILLLLLFIRWIGVYVSLHRLIIDLVLQTVLQSAISNWHKGGLIVFGDNNCCLASFA